MSNIEELYEEAIKKFGEPRTFEEAVDIVFYIKKTILVERQQKYGPENIAKFGVLGCIIRDNDKLERMTNLLFQGGDLTQDETMMDTLVDLGNYPDIALMVAFDIWGMPLAGTIHAPPVVKKSNGKKRGRPKKSSR